MATRGQSKVNLVTVTIAALLGLGVGFGLVVFTSGDTSEEPSLASMADVQVQESPDAATEASGAAAASEATQPAEPAEPAEPEPSEPASTGDAVLASCVDAVARADDAVAAAKVSLGNWKTHYGAQVAFDRGEITADEAKRRWAESKAPAQDNVAAFLEARDAVPTDDPCSGGDVEALGDTDRQTAQQCSAQLNAFSDVLSATDTPLKAWREHITMMDNRDQYAVDEYLAIWRQTVAEAPGPMQTFEEAASAYDEIGSCDA